MNIRWFTTYDKNGIDSKKVLQYWNNIYKRWENVANIRVPINQEEESLSDRNMY